ncbi:MAG: DNA helicase [Alteromonadaceae bacterium]|uniref:cory-CC-star protein n=1 Tax=unclassified Marinobacter TaxID=83889 RepID=UPI000C631C9F|nr:cory-CC-star protein [Marinobacter sp. BGYM27]MAA63719.1 DNA helicase [Alteromonadaceae bacterium]MBH84385.1 DNA helicase [Alteromonadaceae bacterium]MDG5498421.1 cory-CC-star protein [Marinobacter sp. BGYM27]|tara:strand:+ start:9567 stop:9845 length:279 start_codon:yes stop_codon:yes gene_type:complete
MNKTLARFKYWYRRASAAGTEYYNAPYRAAIARAQRDEDDLFMLLVFGEMMGIPNPASWYCLELQPLLLERFHDWHTRMGMERSPLDNMRCC